MNYKLLALLIASAAATPALADIVTVSWTGIVDASAVKTSYQDPGSAVLNGAPLSITFTIDTRKGMDLIQPGAELLGHSYGLGGESPVTARVAIGADIYWIDGSDLGEASVYDNNRGFDSVGYTASEARIVTSGTLRTVHEASANAFWSTRARRWSPGPASRRR